MLFSCAWLCILIVLLSPSFRLYIEFHPKRWMVELIWLNTGLSASVCLGVLSATSRKSIKGTTWACTTPNVSIASQRSAGQISFWQSFYLRCTLQLVSVFAWVFSTQNIILPITWFTQIRTYLLYIFFKMYSLKSSAIWYNWAEV